MTHNLTNKESQCFCSDYVSFESAKLLARVGLPQRSDLTTYFRPDGGEWHYCDDKGPAKPTLWQAMKWLRVMRSVDIWVNTLNDAWCSNVIFPSEHDDRDMMITECAASYEAAIDKAISAACKMLLHELPANIRPITMSR